jgi:methionyl-tRNA formyltransferase
MIDPVMKNLRIVFMGTPEFAVASLGSLLMNGYNVVGVVTAPDKPSGRGRQITKSEVKKFSEFSYLPILQPENLKDPQFISDLEKLKPDLFIVVAFRMLPELVWRMPSLCTFNLHASLLPHYRGASPINYAIINGETVTGVTTFLIDKTIDTGKILFREEIPIFPFECAGDLHDKLMKLGARVVIQTVGALVTGKFEPMAQENFIKPGETIKSAPKIHPLDCIINWNNDLMNIHNLIRGLCPYPCAKSFFVNDSQKLSFKIFESHAEIENHNYTPGEIVSDGKHYLKIACKSGFLHILNLQLEGKNKMNTMEFLRGFKISEYKISSTQAV